MQFYEYLNPELIIKTVGLTGLVLIIFAESGVLFGVFFPGDSLLFTAGFLASQGYMNIYALVVLCFIAAVAGDNFGYFFGKKIGPAIFTKKDSFFFSHKRVEEAEKFYEKHGKKAIILARFMPVVRTFAPILAGVGRMNYKTFMSYNLIGGGIWVFGMCLLGFILGSVIPNVDRYVLPIVIFIILTSFLPMIVNIIKTKFSKNKI